MRLSRPKEKIISVVCALLLASLAACSSVRLAYGNASLVTWWWLDGYVDFSNEQTPAAKRAVDSLFDWHRRTQLADYTAVLATAQTQVVAATTTEQACRWQALLREKLEPSLQHAIGLGAELVPGLGEAQFKSLEKAFAKDNRKMRDDFLQPDAEDREEGAVKRVLERAERLYGRLDEPQLRVVKEGVAASPFDPALWLQDRQRRQQDTVQTLRQLVAERAPLEQRQAALRGLLQRAEKSPEPDYRAYQVKLAEYNCAFAARLHNATTAAQRQKARETLKGWEEDLRSFSIG